SNWPGPRGRRTSPRWTPPRPRASATTPTTSSRQATMTTTRTKKKTTSRTTRRRGIVTAPWGPAATSDDQHLLDEAESARIFRERIVPDQLNGVPQEQPIVVFVGGQPGDGKASITA